MRRGYKEKMLSKRFQVVTSSITLFIYLFICLNNFNNIILSHHQTFLSRLLIEKKYQALRISFRIFHLAL